MQKEAQKEKRKFELFQEEQRLQRERQEIYDDYLKSTGKKKPSQEGGTRCTPS